MATREFKADSMKNEMKNKNFDSSSFHSVVNECKKNITHSTLAGHVWSTNEKHCGKIIDSCLGEEKNPYLLGLHGAFYFPIFLDIFMNHITITDSFSNRSIFSLREAYYHQEKQSANIKYEK